MPLGREQTSTCLQHWHRNRRRSPRCENFSVVGLHSTIFLHPASLTQTNPVYEGFLRTSAGLWFGFLCHSTRAGARQSMRPFERSTMIVSMDPCLKLLFVRHAPSFGSRGAIITAHASSWCEKLSRTRYNPGVVGWGKWRSRARVLRVVASLIHAMSAYDGVHL